MRRTGERRSEIRENVSMGPRRAKVFDLLKQGKTAAQISWQMEISQGRVYQHIHALQDAGLIPYDLAEMRKSS